MSPVITRAPSAPIVGGILSRPAMVPKLIHSLPTEVSRTHLFPALGQFLASGLLWAENEKARAL